MFPAQVGTRGEATWLSPGCWLRNWWAPPPSSDVRRRAFSVARWGPTESDLDRESLKSVWAAGSAPLDLVSV